MIRWVLISNQFSFCLILTMPVLISFQRIRSVSSRLLIMDSLVMPSQLFGKLLLLLGGFILNDCWIAIHIVQCVSWLGVIEFFISRLLLLVSLFPHVFIHLAVKRKCLHNVGWLLTSLVGYFFLAHVHGKWSHISYGRVLERLRIHRIFYWQKVGFGLLEVLFLNINSRWRRRLRKVHSEGGWLCLEIGLHLAHEFWMLEIWFWLDMALNWWPQGPEVASWRLLTQVSWILDLLSVVYIWKRG